MERKVVIVHHNDMDGIFSGAIIYDYEKNINKTDWIYKKQLEKIFYLWKI